ncbi:hypothetical protein [Nonomuraea sp. NPDC049400]|uniref:hypothetical protein n=1 Tax=Nonomuraea sp. NPDC049400 TaxID=3364352 RepID=UPI0037A78DD6
MFKWLWMMLLGDTLVGTLDGFVADRTGYEGEPQSHHSRVASTPFGGLDGHGTDAQEPCPSHASAVRQTP